ncbi:L-lactate dehydrogenase (cytochrome) [Epibacterium ulvae]|uniref:L-lactate dehydrogenase (Cytochrome) n=1 Tax=Epibacterium ulvae TaxID=1156985 RepID=A0A1G5QLX8_9RHOB|nr:alpha-hydroxy acid oxidase [Epibacterium ulvae]SCZ62149.1 L-lactate dehydrogenase (cytochrome) [Epibacterium ulvae]
MDYQNQLPSIWHMAERAKRRIPYFAWEYLDSGTGMERLVDRNRVALDEVELLPRALGGRFTPDLSTTLFGQTYSVPFGAAPVGMSGLMWPGAELALAKTAHTKNMPYGLSMVANESIEATAALAPDHLWMQIYCPKEPEVLDDLIARSKAAGVKTLIITVDVPVGSRRERQLAAGLTVPPKMDLITLWRVVKRPHWALATARYGQPRFKTIETYFPQDQMREGAKLIGNIVDGRPDWEYFDRIREKWAGTLVIKGIMHSVDAEDAIEHGADAVWVSNHGGRQFDGAPAAITVLPKIAEIVAKRVPVLFDSGIRGGLDIARALSLGADFCFAGRGFLYAIGALGAVGGDHAYEVLRGDLENNMIQLGAKTIPNLRTTNV